MMQPVRRCEKIKNVVGQAFLPVTFQPIAGRQVAPWRHVTAPNVCPTISYDWTNFFTPSESRGISAAGGEAL